MNKDSNKQAAQDNHFESILKRYKPENMDKLPADIKYLLDDKISLVLSEGFNVLYRAQPHHPIDFFAKWLLNYEATQKHKTEVHQADNKVKEVIKKYDEAAEIRRKREAELEAFKAQVQKFEKHFREKIKNHDYHEELLNNDLPSFIEKQKGLLAVYIGMLEHPSRAIHDEEEEEYAHLDTSQPKIITYIGASGTHKFMMGRELKPGTGVTYSVFQPPQKKEEEEGAGAEAFPQAAQQNYLYVPDVTKEPKIFFFRIPKLGAYMACPLIYKSVLNEKTFEAGVKERLRVQNELKKQQKEKEERDQDYEARIQETQEAGLEIAEIEQEWKNYEWPKIEEKEFEYEERKFVLCVDTLGEDRELKQEEKDYVLELTETFVKCWEESEKRQLSRDIDLYIQDRNDNKREEFIEELESKLQTEIEEKYEEVEGETELEQNYKKAVITAEYYKSRLMEDNVKKMIKSLANYRFIRFRTLIQNIMYFLKYRKGQVNVPGTNILEWKEVKKIISRDDFFKKLESYEFRGPRQGYWEKYALANRLAQKLEKFSAEEIEEYNLGLGVLYRFVKHTLEARLLDIKLRRTKQAEEKRRREELIQEAENLQAQKERELEAAINTHLQNAPLNEAGQPQPEEEFNREEWDKQWEEEHPPIVIPPEVVDDIDEDIE